MVKYVKDHNGVEIDPNSIFDVQIKRLHAYKRQLLNVFRIIHLYKRMKSDPSFRIYPRTFIFGAKAAPSYTLAKSIIELINVVASKVNGDPETNKYLKVVFLENYGVSTAEMLIPARMSQSRSPPPARRPRALPT
uniref:Alpha-1,4 glucan phosphorylase n=1 Tax=uncultured Catenibacterium sp. TaxID=286142 RepID=A0A060CBV7_9FIRM|nr:phosphorylase [uncultured Catenibacterium sp.]